MPAAEVTEPGFGSTTFEASVLMEVAGMAPEIPDILTTPLKSGFVAKCAVNPDQRFSPPSIRRIKSGGRFLRGAEVGPISHVNHIIDRPLRRFYGDVFPHGVPVPKVIERHGFPDPAGSPDSLNNDAVGISQIPLHHLPLNINIETTS